MSFELPKLIMFNDYNGDWEKYLSAIYLCFKNDFIDSPGRFNGKVVQTRREPMFQRKESCFWHIITKGKIEENRTPDMARCARIKWPRYIIDNFKNKKILYWENERKKDKRGIEKNICLCTDDWSYLVVLAIRDRYVLFVSAYPLTYKHSTEKAKKEYFDYKNRKRPL